MNFFKKLSFSTILISILSTGSVNAGDGIALELSGFYSSPFGTWHRHVFAQSVDAIGSGFGFDAAVLFNSSGKLAFGVGWKLVFIKNTAWQKHINRTLPSGTFRSSSTANLPFIYLRYAPRKSAGRSVGGFQPFIKAGAAVSYNLKSKEEWDRYRGNSFDYEFTTIDNGFNLTLSAGGYIQPVDNSNFAFLFEIGYDLVFEHHAPLGIRGGTAKNLLFKVGFSLGKQ